MSNLFKKSIGFHVERYEEWQGGRCTNQGVVNFDLQGVATNDSISFEIPNASSFKMHNKCSFNFCESTILNDRIQYVKAPSNSTDSTLPIVCHIFLKNDTIDYIRFAMSFPNRIIEFYGHPIESTEHTLTSLTETERFVNEGINQLELGNDGDATYYPLLKAWKAYRRNPKDLQHIHNYHRYGMGLMSLLTYETIEDIDIQQEIASIAYLFLSKAIKQDVNNIDAYKDRALMTILNTEAFEYTVSSVVNKNNQDICSPLFSFRRFNTKDSLDKMIYADLCKHPAILRFDFLRNKKGMLDDKLLGERFGRNATAEAIIQEGKKIHDDVFDYLEQKILVNLDLEF